MAQQLGKCLFHGPLPRSLGGRLTLQDSIYEVVDFVAASLSSARVAASFA